MVVVVVGGRWWWGKDSNCGKVLVYNVRERQLGMVILREGKSGYRLLRPTPHCSWLEVTIKHALANAPINYLENYSMTPKKVYPLLKCYNFSTN